MYVSLQSRQSSRERVSRVYSKSRNTVVQWLKTNTHLEVTRLNYM